MNEPCTTRIAEPSILRKGTPCVLDTNVVLDWLVFGDPHGLALGERVMRGELRWLQTPAMRAELEEVISRLSHVSGLQRWAHRSESALEMSARWACPIAAPAPLPPHRRAHCSDCDDQIFIDLAVALEIPWLFSRDRAVLKLRRKLAVWGIGIVSPREWLVERTNPGQPEAEPPQTTAPRTSGNSPQQPHAASPVAGPTP